MAKERFLQRKDRDEDEPQPRRGSGKTRKRLTQAAAIAAGILPMAPGTALAQAPSQPVKPSLPDQILQKQVEIWQATNGDPTYEYPDRNALAGGIGRACVTSNTDLLTSASTSQRGRKIKITVKEFDGMAPATVAGQNVIISGQTPVDGRFNFNCNTVATDGMTGRVMKRTVRKTQSGKYKRGAWRPYGSTVELTPDSLHYDVQRGDQDVGPSTRMQGVLRAAGSIISSKLRRGSYGVQLKNVTESDSPLGPAPSHGRRTIALSKRIQTRPITR